MHLSLRFPQYYYDEGVQKRILTKAYGVLFKIEISGTVSLISMLTSSVLSIISLMFLL